MSKRKQAIGPLTVQPLQYDHGASLCVVHPRRGIVAKIGPTNEDEDPDMDSAKRNPWDEAYMQLFAASPSLLEAAKKVLERHGDGCGDHCRVACEWCGLRNAITEAEVKA